MNAVLASESLYCLKKYVCLTEMEDEGSSSLYVSRCVVGAQQPGMGKSERLLLRLSTTTYT